MYKKILTSICTLVLLGLAAGQAMAGTVQLTQSNPITTDGATILNLNLVGTSFTDGDPSLPGIQSVDGAAFTISWNSTVLQYTGIVVSDPNWDSPFIDDTSAAAGTVDFVFLGRSAGFFGSDFNIVDLSFNVIGAAGSATDIIFADVFGGWSLGGVTVPVDYVAGQVAVTSVPVPAAAWLFGSGLIGLVGVARRRSA